MLKVVELSFGGCLFPLGVTWFFGGLFRLPFYGLFGKRGMIEFSGGFDIREGCGALGVCVETQVGLC